MLPIIVLCKNTAYRRTFIRCYHQTLLKLLKASERKSYGVSNYPVISDLELCLAQMKFYIPFLPSVFIGIKPFSVLSEQLGCSLISIVLRQVSMLSHFTRIYIILSLIVKNKKIRRYICALIQPLFVICTKMLSLCLCPLKYFALKFCYDAFMEKPRHRYNLSTTEAGLNEATSMIYRCISFHFSF